MKNKIVQELLKAYDKDPDPWDVMLYKHAANLILDLDHKIVYLIDSSFGWDENGGFTFPDGEYIKRDDLIG